VTKISTAALEFAETLTLASVPEVLGSAPLTTTAVEEPVLGIVVIVYFPWITTAHRIRPNVVQGSLTQTT